MQLSSAATRQRERYRRVALPDHHFTRGSEPPVSFKLLLLLALFAVSVPVTALSQQAPLSAAELPAVLPGNAYRADGAARVLTADQYAVVHGADVFVEYGLERVTMRRYASGRSTMMVEVFEMRFPTGSYGLLTFNRGSLPVHRREFASGRYLVSIAMEPGGTPVDPLGLRAVEELFASQGLPDIPPLISHLPVDKRVEGSERYLVGPAALTQIQGFADHAGSVDFTGGVEVGVADYQTGNGTTRLVIIEYHTPQSATFGFESATNRLQALSEEEKGRRILKRVGNYVVEALVEGDSALARSIVDQVKYEIKIYWEGRKFTSIPLRYRPADPAAAEELAETANVLLRTFYGIGLMLVGAIILGIFAGWSAFYWRKHRRRRLGMDNYFSDAGDTVRLNLDDYIFQPNEQPIKLLGKGDL